MLRSQTKFRMRAVRRHVFLGALCCIGLMNFQSAHSVGDRRIVSVRISQDPVRRSEDLQELAQFDVLGVSLGEGLAELGVSDKQLEQLKRLGFQIEFSPLNTQLQREFQEPYLTPRRSSKGFQD